MNDFLIWLRDIHSMNDLTGWVGPTVGYYWAEYPLQTGIVGYYTIAIFFWILPPSRLLGQMMITGSVTLPFMLAFRWGEKILGVVLALVGKMGVASANQFSEHLMRRRK